MPIYQMQKEVDGEMVTIFIEMDKAVSQGSIYGDVRGTEEAAKQVVKVTRDMFGDAVELAKSCAVRVIDGMKDMEKPERPDEFKVQFAIRFNTEVGAILAKMGTEAELLVTMKWKRQEGS